MTPPEPRASAPAETAVICTHCGLPVPSRLVRPEREEQFCCNGCEQVYGILHDWGFAGYYRLLDRTGGRGVPARVSGRQFQDFDDPAFLAEHSRAASNGRRSIRLYLEGVHCAACVWLVEGLPRAVDGLLRVELNLATGVAEVEWDGVAVPLSRVAQALDAIGYTPHVARRDELVALRRREDRALLLKLGVAGACAMNIMFIHLALYAGEASDIEPRFEQFFRWMSFALSLPVLLYSALPFFRGAWAGLSRHVPHIDLPIAIALVVTFAASAVATVAGHGPVYFDSLAGLVALLLGGRWVQQRAQRIALERTHALRSSAFAEYARRLDESGVALEVPAQSLARGDRVEVRPGDLVPVDGLVIAGESSLDQAMLTGESTPVPVGPGDAVFAGATNLSGRLVLDVRAAGSGTRVGGLLALVDEAMSRRTPLVQWADRLSRVFVASVLGGAVLLALAVFLASDGDAALALTRAVALLVVTCPCGLGLAMPVALAVALSRAARTGIFVKNPTVIELCGDVGTVILDKTGTLTQGTARVIERHGAEAAIELALALESESTHLVAQALRRSFHRPLRQTHRVEAVRETPGRGADGRVDGRAVVVGNAAQLAQQGVGLDARDQATAAALAERGQSPVFVAVDGRVEAILGLGDPIRPDARAALAILQRRGLELVVLSGDHPEVVRRVASSLGIQDARGGLTPEEKRDAVAALVAERKGARVMMVGDGVNDAAALALADVGVVVHGGAGAAVFAADVVLTRDGLSPVVDLFDGSARVRGVMQRNLLFSLAYNLAGAALAVAGLVGPLLAAVLMPASSFTVILSSAFGRTFTPPALPRTPARS
jgi:Cu2+-exporting ATPase